MTLNEGVSLIEEWMGEIQKAAKKAAVDWPGVVEAEDMAQDIVLHILERPGTQQDLAGMDDTNRYRTIHKIAQRIASQERTDFELFTGDFRYSVDEVRSLLEGAGDPETGAVGSSWSVGAQPGSSGGHSDPTGGTAIRNIGVSDTRKRLSEALTSLRIANERQYTALVQRFVDGETPDRKDTAAFMVIERALTSLTTRMNHGYKRKHFDIKSQATEEAYNTSGDGPGTRRAIRCSTARFITKDGYDADYMPAPTHQRDNHIEPDVS